MDAKNDDKQQNLESNRCEVCQKPALHKCGGCHKIYYCDKSHQREHWKQHKSICKPFKVCENDILGRHLIATRTIKCGEIIIQESPLIWGPSFNTIPICLGCGKGIDETCSRPCRKCGWPVCNDLCEKSPAHLPECRYTSQRGERVQIKVFGVEHPIYKCITVLRCLYQKQFLPRTWKKLENLETHWEEHKATSHYESDRITIAEFIRRFFKLGSVFSEEDIMKIYGTTLVNSHEVPLTEPSYIAIYGNTSMLEHNCSANCSKSFTSHGQIVISAARNIQEGDHLSISYTDSLWGTSSRRYFLHETKFFWCRCARCEDSTEFGTNFNSLKCSIDCQGYLLPKSFIEIQKLPDWVCNKCNRIMSYYAVHDILERIGRDICDLDKNNIKECKNFLKTYEGYLHENHYYCTEVKYILCELIGQRLLKFISDEDLSLKLQYCNSLEKLLKVIAPAEKRTLGTILFEKHAAIAEIARRAGPERLSLNLEKSRKSLLEAIELLKNEPEVLPEGKIHKQAIENLKEVDSLLLTLQSK